MNKRWLKIGDLVESHDYKGWRGIITSVTSSRGSGKPRTVTVRWFPPTQDAIQINHWQRQRFEGETEISCLHITKISAA